METYTIKAKSLNFSEEEFFNFCQDNEEVRFERTADKEILVMTPTGSDTGFYNSSLCGELYVWNKKKKLGYVFDSNAGFTLPNGAVRSPDASWISKERYEVLDKSDRSRFAHICPDFVAEIRSESDNLENLKRKMVEYIENGCRLGWLIDRFEQKVYVYNTGGSIPKVEEFDGKISGKDVLIGFELDLGIFKE